MSDAFDPYYIWLGIPPDDQPPNHYRLLGIGLFEASGDVIEAAANRQMAYMQEVSAGEAHIDEAQKILGELSRARICLLSAEKKEAYDAELRGSFDSLDQASEEQDAEQDADQGRQTPAVAPARDRNKSFLPPQTPAETTAQTEDDEGDTAPILGKNATRVGHAKKHRTPTRPTTRNTARKKKKKQDATIPIVAGIAVGILLLFILVGMFSSSEKKTRTPLTPRERQKAEFAKQRQAKIAKRNRDVPLNQKAENSRGEKTNSYVRKRETKLLPEQDFDAAWKEATKRPAGSGEQPTQEAKTPATPEAPNDNTQVAGADSTEPTEPTEPTETTGDPEKSATATALNDNTQLAVTKPSEPTVTNPPNPPNPPNEPNEPNEQVAPTEQAEPDKPVARPTPPPATMPAQADLNPAQRVLLERAAADYKRATRQEFQTLLARGRELGKANGATWGGLPHGGTTRNSGTKQRCYFLGWHHPEINPTAITPQKKSPEPFYQEMRKAVWEKVRNTPAWKEASK